MVALIALRSQSFPRADIRKDAVVIEGERRERVEGPPFDAGGVVACSGRGFGRHVDVVGEPDRMAELVSIYRVVEIDEPGGHSAETGLFLKLADRAGLRRLIL